jgi:hypothetical protein
VTTEHTDKKGLTHFIGVISGKSLYMNKQGYGRLTFIERDSLKQTDCHCGTRLKHLDIPPTKNKKDHQNKQICLFLYHDSISASFKRNTSRVHS